MATPADRHDLANLILRLADQGHDPQEVGLDEKHTDQLTVKVEPRGGTKEPGVSQ